MHAVDGVRVRGRGERRALDGRALVAAIVPEHDLARVSAADDKVRVELGKARRHNGRLQDGKLCIDKDHHNIVLFDSLVVSASTFHKIRRQDAHL